MQLNLSTQTELSPAMRSTVQRKIDRFARVAPDPVRADVHFEERRNPRIPERHGCTVLLHMKHDTVTAHAHADDPIGALDGVLAKLRHQLERIKGQSVPRGGARRGARRGRRRS